LTFNSKYSPTIDNNELKFLTVFQVVQSSANLSSSIISHQKPNPMKFAYKTAVFTVFTALLLAITPSLSLSQNYFTGSFDLAVWDDVQGDARTTMQLMVSPERMRLSGVASTGLSGRATGPMAQALSADQMLFRLDMQDIVVMTSETAALQIKQAEIQAMINLVTGMNRGASSTAAGTAANSSVESDLTITETRETRRIQGFNARKFIMRDAGSPEAVAHVWVSDDFRVNWGMLLEIPGLLTEWVPAGQVAELFRGGQTPLLLEIFENGELTSRVAMVNVQRGVDRSLLDVPSGVRLMSLQEMILQQMRDY